MGFGRGKGFTSKERTEMTKYKVILIGAQKYTATETTPTYSAVEVNGGIRTATETTPTYTTGVT